ncbi:MAG: TVP38/TMEM64 family protein [Candidatus Omnitrophica bacterium]|nr:TVP38/TMEM64 family protein [Candidatus Omnitrophota bacterium]
MKKQSLKFFIFLVFLLLCICLGRIFHFDIETLRQFFSQYPLGISGAVYIILYIVSTTFIWFGLKDVLRIAGAIIFGPWVSTLLVWLGEMGNCFTLFHISRFLGRGFVQERFYLNSDKLDAVKHKTGFWWILALRINPLVPFRLMDLSFGLTAVKFQKYFWINVFASIPRLFWLQYIIAGIGENIFKDMSSMLTYLLENPFLIIYSSIYFLVVFLLTVFAGLYQMWTLKRATQK